jgi:hypothetical protein
MKTSYQVLYGISIVLFIMVLLGGSLTKGVFESFSTRTLEAAGIKKAAVDSIDSRIDDIFYTVNKIQLQIDKLRNLFSDQQIDESKYQRQQNQMIAKNIYRPMHEVMIIAYRVGLFFISVILFMAGLIAHIAYRGIDLRRRVRKLEEVVLQQG